MYLEDTQRETAEMVTKKVQGVKQQDNVEEKRFQNSFKKNNIYF